MSNTRKDLSDWVVNEAPSAFGNSNKAANDLSDWQVAGNEKPVASEDLSRQRLESIGNDSLLQRPVNRLGEDALSLVKNLWGTVAGGVPATINELAANPVHAGRQLAAGVGTIPITMANTAFNIPQWLAHLESEKASSAIKKYTPQLPTEMYQNLIGGENPTEQDVKVRNLGQLAPIGIPIGKVAGKGIAKSVGNVKSTLGEAFQDVEPYENEAAKAQQEAEEAKTAATVPKPGLYPNPMTDLENVEHDIGKHINAEADHRTRAASQITSRVKDIQKYWGDSYKQFEEKIKDNEFHMPQNVLSSLNINPETVLAKLRQGIDPSKITLEEKNPFYDHLISKAPTAEDTSAKDFLSKYRDFRDTMGGLKEDLKSERYGSIEKEKISDAIKKGSDIESQIKDTLTTGLGEHKPEFDWLMKGYSEQVFPLRRNPVVKAAKAGKLSKNIIDDLRTNESGMDVVRGIVKQDPELLKNVVGQRYITKPEEVHAPNELMREYLDEMPEFKNLLNKREDILNQASNREDISLKNKVEVEKKLREIKNTRSKARTKLMTGGLSTFLPYGYRKVTNLFTK